MNVATNHPLPLVQSARLFALAYMAVHDGQIQVFDSKYTYNFWRPITAIQAGAADNNPDTVPDGSWKPLLETPPHPEYPAAHSEETAALLEVLKSVHGDGTAVTISSPNTSQPRTFASFSELLRDVNDARVWAGAHFRTACLVGSDVGQRIARHALQNYLRPLPVLTPDAQANPGEFQFSFTSGPLASYVVERSNDLTQWLPVTTNIYGAFSFADVSVGDVDHRFYRVRQFNP